MVSGRCLIARGDHVATASFFHAFDPALRQGFLNIGRSWKLKKQGFCKMHGDDATNARAWRVAIAPRRWFVF